MKSPTTNASSDLFFLRSSLAIIRRLPYKSIPNYRLSYFLVISSVLEGVNHSAKAETISGAVFVFLKCPALCYILKKNVLIDAKVQLNVFNPVQFNSTFPAKC